MCHNTEESGARKKKIYKYTEQKSVYYQATHRGKYFVRIYGAFALKQQ